YPKNAPSPILETSLFTGFPDDAPAPGSMPKALNVIASFAYRRQYGLNSCVLVPCNLYVEHDHFDEYNSHVIPSLILKMHKAKKDNIKETVLWGSGSAIRDFCLCSDIVKLFPYFIENDINFESEPWLTNVCNLSTGKGTSIKELAETIA